MTYDFDVIIVGGGPAGSTMALYCVESGLEVLLVDKESFPRDKVCGDALPGVCLSIVKDLGLSAALERLPHARARLAVHSEGRALRRPGAARDSYLVRRLLFDEMLFEAAKSRVATREGLRVGGLLSDGGRVCGVRARTRDGAQVEYTARVVAGADGCSSAVARGVGIARTAGGEGAVATRAYYRRLPSPGNELEMHYLPICRPGYFWIFPVDRETVNVGLLWFCRDGTRHRGSARALHRRLVQSAPFRERFERAEPVGRLESWFLPMGERRREIHGDGFLLTGDAAGLVDPFVGHGIDTAMISGKIAAGVLAEVCRGRDYGARALQPYADAIWRRLGPRFRRSASFRNQVHEPFLAGNRLDLLSRYFFDGGADLARSKPCA